MSVDITREIDSADIPRIKSLIRDVLNVSDYTEIERLGGLTNRTYRIRLDNGNQYAVRIPGEGTEEIINRQDEKISTELACSIGVDANLLYFGDDGVKLSEYIANAVTMSEEDMRVEKRIGKAAEVLVSLHSSSADTEVAFDVFSMAATYEKSILDNGIILYDDYTDVKNNVRMIREESLSSPHACRVPCHNDPLCANWIESEDNLYLIDWEYAGMNDGFWDLAALSIEAYYKPYHDTLLLTSYLKHAPDEEELRHFLANKVFVDYLWTLWALMRIPYDGQPMKDWADERYERMKSYTHQYLCLMV